MSSKVAKGLRVLAVVVALTAMVPVKSEAGSDIGQYCWTFGYNEIRCSATVLDGPETMYGLYCSDRSTTYGYQVSGAGLLRQDAAGKIQMSFVGGNFSGFFGVDTCTYQAELDTATLSGPAVVDCIHTGKYYPHMGFTGSCP
jgi:hypothetical protein